MTARLGREPLLYALVALAALGYSLYGVWEHNHFLTDFDLAIADQAIWHFSHLSTPIITTISPPVNMFGDHLSFLLIVLTPLYWLWSDPRMLLIAQGVLVAASIVPVFLFARPRLGRAGAYAISLAYSIFWAINAGVGFQFHELAFSPLLIALTILFADRRQWPAFFVSLALLLMVKENMSVLAVFIGVWLISGREYRLGAITIAAGVVWYLLALNVLLPHFAGHAYTHWTYTALGSDAGGALKTVITHPDKPIRLLFDNSTKTHTLALIFLPFLALTLCSRLAILTIPLIAQQLLSDFPGYWTPDFHHWLPIAPVVAMGAADGFRNLARRFNLSDTRLARAGLAVGALILAANLFLAVRQSAVSAIYDAGLNGTPLISMIHPGFTLEQRQSEEAPYQAIKAIPGGASVTAAAPLLPHLSQRDDIYLFGYPSPQNQYVVFAPQALGWPDPTYERQWLAQNKAAYRTIYDRDGWVVWQRRS